MRVLKILVGTIVAGLIFFFIGQSLYSNWGKLRTENLAPEPFLLGLSLIALLMSWFISVWILQRIFRGLGYELPYSELYSIYFRTIGGKYVPGKIWQIAGSTYLATKRGVPPGISFTAFLLGQIYSVLSGFLLVAFVLASGLMRISKDALPLTRWNSLALIILIVVVSLKPRLLQIPVNMILSIFKSKPVQIDIGFYMGLKCMLSYIVCWFTFGLAFWLFINALTPVGFQKYVSLTAIHAGAIVIGFLSVFTPGGIGVREGILVLFLSYTGGFGEPLPQVIAVGMRLVTTASEVISFLLTWVIGRRTPN